VPGRHVYRKHCDCGWTRCWVPCWRPSFSSDLHRQYAINCSINSSQTSQIHKNKPILCTSNMPSHSANSSQTLQIFIHSLDDFWHAPLWERSAKRTHHSPEWVILSHINCFVQGEVNWFQVLLGNLHPHSTGATQWSPPVFRGGSCQDLLGCRYTALNQYSKIPKVNINHKNTHTNTIQIKENKQLNTQQKHNFPDSVTSQPGNEVGLFYNGPERHKGLWLNKWRDKKWTGENLCKISHMRLRLTWLQFPQLHSHTCCGWHLHAVSWMLEA